jgi:hypothetical protein
MKYLVWIHQFLSRFSSTVHPDEENRIWNAWLDLKNTRESSDLTILLKSDVRQEFKFRVLIVLLAPDLNVLPFRWDDKDRLRNYLSLHLINVQTLSQDLVDFTGELVCQNIDYVLAKKDAKLYEALFIYNSLILQFLAVLPEDNDLAERLFRRYQINDPVPYQNLESMSGYNPLRHILCARDVPLKWKVLADKQMQDRIVAEVEGRAKPREDWENALQCYASHIQVNYDGHGGYSRELFASQIRFITELPGVEGYSRALFKSWQLIYFMEAISGEELRETRHKLARLVVFSKTKNTSRFTVCDAESRLAAELMLREFGTVDLELAAKLDELLTYANHQAAKSLEEQAQKQQKANEVLNLMQ